MSSLESSVIIVGGGVFGLSTALWLARGGYKNVTIFDRCDFEKNHYNPSNGCDGASADINKIFRATYGSKSQYVMNSINLNLIAKLGFSSQDLALEARDIWLEWNKAIKNSDPSELPDPLTPEDELLTLCGVFHLADGPKLIDLYSENLRAMGETAPSFRDLQFVKV